MKHRKILFALGSVALFFSFATHAQTVTPQYLNGHVPSIVSSLTPIGQLDPSTQLHLAIGLPLRNADALDNLLQQIYDPASPSYRHYLTPGQFTEQFGPAETNYQSVIDFFQSNGLTVTATYANRVVLDVSGNAADVEKVFHTTLRMYQHPTEARTFFAPDVEPSIDLATPILHVSGLDDYSIPHPNSHLEPADIVTPHSGSGPGGSYQGNDFRAAYLPGVTTNQLSGAGQIVGLLQFDGYYSNDIVTYENAIGAPRVSLMNVAIDGGVNTPGDGDPEVSLDIEMVISMAPNVSKIIVYEAPNPSPWPDLLNRMVNDNLAKQISCSWGENSPGSPDPTSEQIFKQMAAQGISFFNASGDSDAFTSGIPFPSESTNITQVGGTTLTTSGPGGQFSSETAWNWGRQSGGTYVGSSGGVSANFGIPSWQQGIDLTAAQGSTTKRNVPDVALTGDNVWVSYNNGKSGIFGGTSCAAPLWAGFIALANQQAAANSQPPVGFINPAIYAIGKGANYTSNFHDVTTGNNFWSSSPTKFAAVAGFDLCTGWGTPKGTNLINTLTVPPDPLIITPFAGIVSSGPIGGPFSITSQIFSLTNSGATSLNWSLFNLPSWLDTSSSGGNLMSGDNANATLSLNSIANNLLPGVYAANLLFSNANSGISQVRTFTLQVGQSVVQNGGFETGDFTFWTLVGTGPNINLVDNGSPITPYDGTYAAAFGQYGKNATLSQQIPTFAGQTYLLSFWLSNPSSALSTQQFTVNWNTNLIFSITNPGIFNWTNMVFVVTATGTNSTLQFIARNDPAYFGLDDVTVQPIPSPSIQNTVVTNGYLQFTWISLSNLSYQVQYTTNLLSPNWINLGSAVTATNYTTTATDSIGPDSQRFYRIRRLP